MIQISAPLRTQLALALALSTSLAGAALAWGQTPPAPRPGPQSFADQQRSQAYATEKLAKSPRRHEWVSIRRGDRTLNAFVTYPEGKAKAPVVLVLHEVFGLTDSTRNTADEIAAMGYITIAADMLSGYGPNGGDTSSFDVTNSASNKVTSLPDSAVNGDLDAWSAWGLKLPEANGKLAIVGLSWGGGAAFRYAAEPHNPALKTVCVFYDVGPPPQTQKVPDAGTIALAPINVPIYGFYGSTDTRVMNSLAATKAAMAMAGKAYDPVVYEGADHAFMRVGEQPADKNAANKAAVQSALARLATILKGI
jgi:carboxymethylenebutenolidase